MAKRPLLLLICVVSLLSAGLARAQDGAALQTLTHDGLERTYSVYVPASIDPEQPAPLVIALGPTGSSGKAMAALGGLDAVADEAGFIVAYPDGAYGYWDDGRDPGLLPPPEMSVDDVGFVGALIDHLAETLPIDTERVYVVGYAGGAGLAYYLACRTPERFAGVAAVGALLWDFETEACEEAEAGGAVNLLMMLGSADEFFPLEGEERPQLDGAILKTLSAEETIAFWTERFGCGDAQTSTDEGIRIETHPDCNGDTRVVLYTIEDAGHGWPRRDRLLSQGPEAAEVLWRFFSGEDDLAGERSPVGDDAYSGPPRSHVLYLPPSYDAAEPLPLVIALHGAGGNGSGFAFLTDLNAVAAEHGFAVVYPDGVDRNWNFADGLPIMAPGAPDHQDTAFIAALIDDLALDVALDRQRVYVVGFSNGGLMAYRLACSLPDRIAAAASVAAPMPTPLDSVCAGSPPISMLLIHGTRDAILTWSQTEAVIRGRRVMIAWSAPDSVGYWAIHDGCDSPMETADEPDRAPEDGATVKRFTFRDCEDETEVVFYAVIGGGHNWPGVPGRVPPQFAGQVSEDINAGQVIWEFFARHALSDSP